MANFKLVISDPKKAKSEVLEVKDSNAQLFMGRRIGEVVDAASSGYKGKLRITGGFARGRLPNGRGVPGGGERELPPRNGCGLQKARPGGNRRETRKGKQGSTRS